MRKIADILADIESVDEQIEAVRRVILLEQREPLRHELQEAYTQAALETYGVAPGDALYPIKNYIAWIKEILHDKPYSLADYLRDLEDNGVAYVDSIEDLETCVVRVYRSSSTSNVPLKLVANMRLAYISRQTRHS